MRTLRRAPSERMPVMIIGNPQLSGRVLYELKTRCAQLEVEPFATCLIHVRQLVPYLSPKGALRVPQLCPSFTSVRLPRLDSQCCPLLTDRSQILPCVRTNRARRWTLHLAQ